MKDRHYLDAGAVSLLICLYLFSSISISFVRGVENPESFDIHNISWGESEDECFTDLALDKESNIFIIGYSFSYGLGNEDIVLLKYSSQGELLWFEIWGGVDLERAEGIALDEEGNIYTVGYTYNEISDRSQIVLLKYNAYGYKLWEQIFNLGETQGSKGLGITLDSEQNIFITGYQYKNVFMMGYVPKLILIKCNSSGDLQWVKEGGGAFECGIGDDITLDENGNIYISGVDPNLNPILVKFNSQGEKQWFRTWNGGNDGWGNSLTLNSDFSNVVVAGHVVNEGMFAVQYDLEGIYVGELKGYGGVVDDFNSLDQTQSRCPLRLKISGDEEGNLYIPAFTGVFGGESNNLAMYEYNPSLIQSKAENWKINSRNYGFSIAKVPNKEQFVMVGKTIAQGESNGDGLLAIATLNPNNSNQDEIVGVFELAFIFGIIVFIAFLTITLLVSAARLRNYEELRKTSRKTVVKKYILISEQDLLDIKDMNRVIEDTPIFAYFPEPKKIDYSSQEVKFFPYTIAKWMIAELENWDADKEILKCKPDVIGVKIKKNMRLQTNLTRRNCDLLFFS